MASLLFGFTSAQAEEVSVATVGPMTGQHAMFGEQLRKGFELAVQDINKSGGLLGKKLNGVIGDDACDPKQAVAVANQMVGKNVKFIAGHFCSGSSIPASEVYAEENILMMSPASTNPMLTEKGHPNVFRFVGRDDQQGMVAGEYIAKNYPNAKIAIVHDKQAYSKGLADEAKKSLNAQGIKEAIYETVTPGEQDYSTLVSKLKKDEIDIVFYGGYHTEAGLIVRQMREQGLKTVLFSGDALAGQEYWSITGDAGTGTLMTFRDPRDNPEAKDIVERFRKQGFEPEGYTVYTYGAVMTWADAVKRAGSFDTDAVAKALKSNQFDTVMGTVSFDKKGDFSAPIYLVYEWNDGTYKQTKKK